MNGTKSATEGFRRITRLGPNVQIRVFGFILLVLCGSILLFWIVRTSWLQLEQLRKEHSAIRSESFYVGVSLRSSVRSINDSLLRFYLSHDPAEESQLLQEASDLRGWIQTNQVQMAQLADLRLLKSFELRRQLDLLARAAAQFDIYFEKITALTRDLHSTQPLTFEKTYQQVRSASRTLFGYCDELVRAQRAGFNEFLAQTQHTLVRQQQLQELFLVFIVSLAVGLGILVYRGMIGPLLLGLRESKTIIERQEKLAALGTLASGVAHEIRNPLTAIKFRLFSLKTALPSLRTNEDAGVIAAEINRLERIVKDFLQFARPSAPELVRLDPGQLLHDVRVLLQGPLERNGISLRLGPLDPGAMMADAQQIKQVIINLVQNGAEAIGRNGTITLSARSDYDELEGKRQAVMVLSIKDTGRGMSPEVESRLFDPFFTTKEGGTGLGLAIASRIVEKHGGMLRYETVEGSGTTFEIVLPAAKNHATTHSDH